MRIALGFVLLVAAAAWLGGCGLAIYAGPLGISDVNAAFFGAAGFIVMVLAVTAWRDTIGED